MGERRALSGSITAITAMAMLLGMAGCGGGSDMASPNADATHASPAAGSAVHLSSDSFPLTITDTIGREVTIEKRPERVVFLAGTPLNVWYDAGGTAVGRPELTENIRLVEDKATQIMALPSVGMPYATDTEAVAGLNPDLVIGMDGPQNSAVEKLQGLGMDAILIKIRSFENLQQVYRAFGVLAGSQDVAERRLREITAQSEKVVARVPDKEISVVILFVSAQTLAVKLDNSIAAQMADSLGMRNIASGLTPDNPGSETTPLDIEEIVRQQPGYVLVTSMIGSNDQARKTLQGQIDSNPAWHAIDAVRAGRVGYLPQQYFLFNAGPYYADALEYLAASVHPDVFGTPVEP